MIFFRLVSFFLRLNIEILGALLKNATFVKDYDYVIGVLEYAMNENVRPSPKFYEVLSTFKYYHSKSRKLDEQEEHRRKYNQFYAVYKKWSKQMGLEGLTKEEAIKLLDTHPWRQLKEAEGDGIELLKNERTRRFWKKQHTLKKLTPNHLNHLQSGTIETIENSQKK